MGGHRVSEERHRKCVELLRNGDVEMRVIAQRLGIAPARVSQINRQYGIRNYNGGHRRFTMDGKQYDHSVTVK